MLEIPHGTKNASLKNSLRSPSKISKKSQCISKNDSVSKNDKRNITEVSNSEENNYEIVKKVQSDNLVEKNASNEEVKILPHIPLTLGTLEKCSGDFSLSSTSSSSLISPTSNPIVPKKKKKLNDCIAMLTCKIQEKLGVNFFETSISTEAPPSDQLSCVSPCSSLKAIDLKLVDNNSQLASLLKSPVFDIPVQDEVIDLSLKKRKATIENTTKEINKIFKETNSTESKIIPEISPGMNPSAVRSVNDELKVPNERESKVEIAKSINEYDSKTEEDKKDGIENQIMKEIVFNKSYSENNLIEKSKEEASKNISENLKENNSLVLEPLLEEQSFKISIPKVKIPNLKEILDQHQVITVNKIKISEQERRAFEEQKNRILQILNKAHNATKTVSGRKVLHKKYSKKAVKRKPSRRKISLRKPTVKNYGPVKQNSEVQSGMSKSSPVVDLDNIADVIKTTNRIRCRRLSVVVDPIINLSTLKNTNRKIRLTNNSQQNGFYELLSSSEQVFGKDESNNARKSNTLLCYGSSGTNVKSEIFLSSENEKTDINALKVPSRTRGNKSRTINSTNNHVIAAITNKNEVDDNPSIEEIVKNETIKPIVCNSEPNVNEKISSLKFIKPSVSTRKSRMRNQNVKKVSLATTDITSDENQIKEHANQYLSTNESKKISKIQEKKSPTKNNKTKNTPLEEIKDEQRVKHVNTKLQLEKRKKLTREKQQLKTEKILDISFSSDTSNENDMPLSKLISPMENEVSTVIEIFSDSVKIDSMVEKESVEFQQLSTIGKTEGILRNDQQIEEPKMSINVSSDSFKIALTVKQSDLDYSTGKKCLKNNKKASKKIKEKLSTNKINHVEEEQKKSISLPVVAPLTECKIKKENDNFTINEDSFFNDDLDNDHSDKINDIVNNIINSSEFQIDSETEKSFHENEIANNQILPSCTICKRTFRNETVLKKHCKTSTHIMKVQRKYRGMSRLKEKTIEKSDVYENAEVSESHSPSLDDAKVFRTKGALKTFDNILDTPVKEEEEQEIKINNQESSIVEKPVIKPKQATVESMLDANDDKLYYEFKMEKKPEDMTPKDRDKLFDSLFNTLEVNAFENCKPYTPKSNFSTATFLDSEIESSSTSWDLKHDPDIEWEGDNIDNVPFANAIKERYPKKFPIRINKSKDTAVSIPTKSLIMDKIFKKHRDRSKLKIPQADAPKNMPGIKNSLDEIFDHLKNSAEIDDKVLTCPSPKTLLKSASETFSPNSSNSNNMLETASQSYNNNYYPGKLFNCNLKKEGKKTKVKDGIESDLFHDSVAEDFDSTIGKRKSRRRCAIKTKTFAETWSSDEYEELHDTADIISIINEIEKRESIKKRKLSKTEEHYKKFEDNLIDESLFKNDIKCSSSKIYEAHVDKKPLQSGHQISLREKIEKKKTAQIELSNETNQSDRSFPIKKKKGIKEAEGHKSDEETFTATKNVKPIKAGVSIKKRRMSCFVPSTTSFDDRTRSKLIVKPTKETLRKINLETLRSFPLENKTFEIKSKSMISKAESEKSYKNQKKFVNLSNNFSSHKKKIHKHRKRPRNRIKNIAYDSDSDFELNLNTKSKTSTLNESSLSENEKDEENDHKTVSFKTKKSMMTLSKSCNTCDMTTLKELKLIPNDLKHVDVSSTTFASAITHDILDPSQSACNRTKRNSSEKLYYWSSSSSESDQEQGDTADGDNEDSALPQQPEQHGWIVGDSHKKLVTLLAHAKIKNKLN
ncbi:CLUMA_CG012800, isoform A [Clunio marinus]|uniref:CLUMA_CG012800, isoform A n=1 Tax=Clunio marinus TaxID=568069 RepID=A0A1J1IK74_9DIPT|nr:CLUMA_CG012800, isoform A [Clunio marinus]